MATAAAVLPMASSAIEMGAAASHSNDENTNAVPVGGGGQRHKRARQMNQPAGPTGGPAGLDNPNTEPVRSPYHIVSHIFANKFCFVFQQFVFSDTRPMNRISRISLSSAAQLNSSTRPYGRSSMVDRRDRDCIYLSLSTTAQRPRWNVSGGVRPRL